MQIKKSASFVIYLTLEELKTIQYALGETVFDPEDERGIITNELFVAITNSIGE